MVARRDEDDARRLRWEDVSYVHRVLVRREGAIIRRDCTPRDASGDCDSPHHLCIRHSIAVSCRAREDERICPAIVVELDPEVDALCSATAHDDDCIRLAEVVPRAQVRGSTNAQEVRPSAEEEHRRDNGRDVRIPTRAQALLHPHCVFGSRWKTPASNVRPMRRLSRTARYFERRSVSLL